jgi:hypothetical protein
MKDIIVKNKKILDFYSQNPGINFEAVNLIFVDLFERLLGDMNSAMNSTINSQILSTVGELKTEINSLSVTNSNMNSQILSSVGDLKGGFNSLSSALSKLNNDITNSIYIKFQESKREYMEDIKTILYSNLSQNSDKIYTLLNQNTSQLIDKTTLLLNEIIPKSNEGYYRQLHESISLFHKSISDDTTKLLQSADKEDKEDSLSIFLTEFESKSSNLLQPLFSCINATEERINTILISLKDDNNNFESKSNTLLQPLFSFINTSEERINKNVLAIKDDNNIESKSNTLLQPLFSFINASEERINKNVISLKDATNNSAQDKIMNELSEFLGKYKNSSYKGQFGENQLETVLNQLFPSAEVINSTGIKASCDFRINRTNQPTILVETKNYDRNVTLDEVKKFIRDIEEQKCHGIFLSQHSGITSKQNFQIDIKGTNILVYVHNVDYCPHTIKIATDIIDSLSDRLAELEEDVDEICIPKETLDDINKEYSRFIERKSTIIDILKDFQKKIYAEFDEIKFPCLSKYLVSKCGSILNNENETIVCNICNKFEATNNRSLGAHQKGCRRKLKSLQNDSNIVINTNV